MIRANFNAYGSYVTDSVNQWDINHVLRVTGLNLTSAPEVHFSNVNVDRAIVRQSIMTDHVVEVSIPNSLLQDPLTIKAHIGVYEGDTFKVVEQVEIPVKPRKRPADYQLEDSDGEVYSFKRLENKLANAATKAQVANIVANANQTDGNSELIDTRYGADGKTYASAGEAVREQFTKTGLKYGGVIGANSGYASFDDLPPGYAYKIFVSGLTNAPAAEVGLLECVVCEKNDDTYVAQRYTTTNGEVYTRVKWYGQGWLAWERMAFANEIAIGFGGTITSTSAYTNADDLPAGKIYKIFNKAMTNLPAAEYGILECSVAQNGDDTYILQKFTTNVGEAYTRVKWYGQGWGEWKHMTNEVEIRKASLSVFSTIGVIGDSFASGQIYVNGTPTVNDDLSWGKIMGRQYGVDVTNFAIPGATSRSWLTEPEGLAKLKNEGEKGLYIIALGINDSWSLGADYVGTAADFNLSNYETAPDTFYGNMSKIIGNILAKNSKAKIVLSTMSYNTSAAQVDVNRAIIDIGELAGLPVIVQYKDRYFTSAPYTSRMSSSHPTAANYSGMAAAIARMIEDATYTYADYFADFVG